MADYTVKIMSTWLPNGVNTTAVNPVAARGYYESLVSSIQSGNSKYGANVGVALYCNHGNILDYTFIE